MKLQVIITVDLDESEPPMGNLMIESAHQAASIIAGDWGLKFSSVQVKLDDAIVPAEVLETAIRDTVGIDCMDDSFTVR